MNGSCAESVVEEKEKEMVASWIIWGDQHEETTRLRIKMIWRKKDGCAITRSKRRCYIRVC